MRYEPRTIYCPTRSMQQFRRVKFRVLLIIVVLCAAKVVAELLSALP